MRATLAFAVLMLGLNGAALEPQDTARFTEYLRAVASRMPPSAVQIESYTARGDRLAVVTAQPRAVHVEIFKRNAINPALVFASASTDIGPEAAASALSEVSEADTDEGSGRPAEVSLDDLCNLLLTSARDNDLPMPFFANLIWQESHLKDDAVSSKGAMGIAQFMPETAADTGLDDPFDPLQAIPASARFLQRLREQFGNLGFVAAAYNAGPRRVAEWLERRHGLPLETRNYVLRVTGLTVDAWRRRPVADSGLAIVPRLPCRTLPAFADFERQDEQTKVAQTQEQNVPVTARDGDRHRTDHSRRHIRTESCLAAHHARKHEAARHLKSAEKKTLKCRLFSRRSRCRVR